MRTSENSVRNIATELSLDALSATIISASGEYLIMVGKNCLSRCTPFQFNMTTAVRFIIMF
jgi:hypothetical protein